MTCYITANDTYAVFELGTLYGLFHAWNLSKCTQDSKLWKMYDYEREQTLKVMEIPMKSRIQFDSLMFSNLDCNYETGEMKIVFDINTDDLTLAQEFVSSLAGGYDMDYARQLKVMQLS